jgi:hypothetical protein
MTPERWEQVQQWFNRLVNLPLEQKRSELEKLGADDPGLRREVEVMLGSGEPGGDFLHQVMSGGSGGARSGSGERRDRVGQTISHYRIEERLGGGGMGVVYKAQDLRLDRYVALKFLPPATDDDEERLKRLIVEARAASALDHPNICTIYQIDQTHDGHWFIVMAYYAGETLKAHIERRPMPVAEVLDYAAQMAQGLIKAHKEGIVHRDLKPANLILTPEGVVKILDFGLAQLVAQTKLTAPGTRLGTPAYMSPEQAQGQPLDHRTDIWSLGVVIYEMLAGRSPFKGEYELAVIYSIVNEEPTALEQVRPDTPPELLRLVARALSKDPRARYQRVEDVLHEIELLRGTPTMQPQALPVAAGPVSAPPDAATPVPQPALRAAAPKKVLAYLALAAAAVILVVLALVLRTPPAAEPPAPPSQGAVTETPAVPEDGLAGQPSVAPDAVEVEPEPAAQARAVEPAAAPPAAPAPPKARPAEERQAPRREVSRNEAATQQRTPPDNSAAQELADWTRIRGSEDIAVFETFLRDHPNGALRQDAQSRIDDLRWQAARAANDPAALERYLQQNPNSRYTAQARARIQELRPPPPPEPAPVTKAELPPAPVTKAEPPPEPAPVAKAEPPPAAAPASSEADAIRDVLRRYGEAYRARDAEQVAALWPTLNPEQLRRIADSFRVAVSIEQDLIPLAEPAIRGNEASVRCRRMTRYEDERGPQRPVDEQVTVSLRKQQGAWVIQAVN